MSHEVRTPLNAVLGFAQFLRSGMPPPNAVQKKVDEIREAGWYLLGLIDEVLNLSLIESDRLSWVLEPMPLAKVPDQYHALVEWRAAAGGIHWSLARPDTSYIVTVDRTRTKQVSSTIPSKTIKYNR